jgi:hypothetical protein
MAGRVAEPVEARALARGIRMPGLVHASPDLAGVDGLQNERAPRERRARQNRSGRHFS